MTSSKKIQKHSQRFIASLDRSVLGSFASDERLLTLNDTLYRIPMHYGGVPKIPSNSSYYRLHDDFLASLSARRFSAALDDYIRWNLDSELLFWWEQHDESKMTKYYLKHYHGSVDHNVIERFGILKKVNTYPEMYDYFISGIWDIAFITRCIQDGIDPALALSMLASNPSQS